MDTHRLGWIAVFGALGTIAALGCFGPKLFRTSDCRQRDAQFQNRVGAIKQDALKRLKIGVSKAEVVQFFADHNISITISGSEASGTLYTFGCAPFSCAGDSAQIRVRVKLDDGGAVKEEPLVVGMYTRCV